VDLHYSLDSNNSRTVGFNKAKKRPEDVAYASDAKRTAPQTHY
jgi:hypothetical protein